MSGGPGRPAGALDSRTRPLTSAVADDDLLAGLGRDGFAWIHDGGSLIGEGVAARVPTSLAEAAAASAELLASVSVDDPLSVVGSGPVVVSAFPFDPTSPGELVVPSRLFGRNRQGLAWVTETGPAGSLGPEAGPSVARRHGPWAEPTRFSVDGGGGHDRWTKAVEEALALISAGELAKVVLARRVVVEADLDFVVGLVLDRLRRAHPSCFTYAVGGFVGASPELLVRRRGGLVVSRPMAGTVERGDTADDDRRALAGMAASAKERTEHRLVVEAVRAWLEPLCDEVSASAEPEVARLATVAHLATTVAGRLRAPAPSALAVAATLHPTPAVAGSPRPAALAAIAVLEDFDRGRYSGPVGWVDERGDGDWAVAVRCAQIDGARALLAAGAGIVAGSEPEAEWAETQAKLDPMLRALVRP